MTSRTRGDTNTRHSCWSRRLLRLLCICALAGYWSLTTSLRPLVTGYWPLSTVAEADVSRGTDKRLQSSSTNQGGGTVTSSRFRQQASIGEPVAGHNITSGRFRMVPGFLGASLGTNTPLPATDLDITVLYAKTELMGTQIQPQAWQRDTDPVFVWEPPTTGLQLAGYSYAIDAAPDDIVETTATSLDLATSRLGAFGDGKHTFSVKAVNTAGSGGAAKSIEIWVDSNPPQITNYAPAPGTLFNSLATAVTATVADMGSGVTSSTVSLLINGRSVPIQWNAATGALTSAESGGWKEGPNSVELRAADVVGNTLAPLIWSVTVDATPPMGSILINGGAQMTTSLHVNLTVSATDASSGVDRMLLSNDEHTGYVEEPYVALRELWALHAVRGTQNVFVKFADKAGNISQPVSDAIGLGLLSPDTVITSGPAGFTQTRTATFAFMCPEGECVYSYSFDDHDWSAWSMESSATSEELPFGNHYFRVKAAKEVNGLAGIQLDEEDPSSAERTWVVGVEPSVFMVPKGPPIKVWRIE